jgi:hypothetical protein
MASNERLDANDVLLGIADVADRAFSVVEIRHRIEPKHPGVSEEEVERLVGLLVQRGLVEDTGTGSTYRLTYAGRRHLRSGLHRTRGFG